MNDLVVRNNDFQNTNSQKIVSHGAAYKDAEEDWSGNRYSNSKSSSGWFTLQGATTSLDAWKSKVESSAQSGDAGYPDPSRTAGSFNATLGGANNTDAFLAEVRKQSADNWRAKYTATAANDYIEAWAKCQKATRVPNSKYVSVISRRARSTVSNAAHKRASLKGTPSMRTRSL